MSEAIPYTTIMERVKGDIEYIANEAYQKGYALGKYEASHWIPCTEHLPKKNQTVLVSVNDGAVYVDVDIYKWDEFFEHEENVTAWMPIPEPFKGGD